MSARRQNSEVLQVTDLKGRRMEPARVILRVLRAEGATGVSQRVARAAYRRSGARASDFALRPEDISDSVTLRLETPAAAPPIGAQLRVAWVTTPPAPGSGGHTTMFRMVEAVEAAGHTCTIYLYDRYRGDVHRHARTVRAWWPGVLAEVREVDDGMEGADVVVATSWPTAHVVAAQTRFAVRRMYLVQDYEPYFYPRGSEYALAEDTYRFGFRCVTIGNMVADLLQRECGVSAAVATFGCDSQVYRLTNPRKRSGIVFYARPDAPRRGFELAVLALAEIKRRRPDQVIHVFGDDPRLPFDTVMHGRLTPAQLCELYNQCAAGLALSFTNISLTAAEMLACGVVPVVNDHEFARADLNHSDVRWAPATPAGLADHLEEAVARSPARPFADQAPAGHVGLGSGWTEATGTFLRTLEDEVWSH